MFKSKRPEPFQSHLCWRVIPTPGGTELKGWTAGPEVGVYTHWGQFSKPCRHHLTDGAIPCPLGPKCRPRYVAYLPLYEATTMAPVVVILARTVALKWQGIKHGQPLKITRPLKGNHPAVVLHTLGGEDLSPSRTRSILDRAPVDIRPYLLHLWQDRVLCNHFGVEMIESPATAAAVAPTE